MKSHSFRIFTLFSFLISLFANAAMIVTPARAAGEPTVTSVISNTANGTFNQGDSISVNVQFSEDVNVDTSGGTPSICFETGITDRCVNYASGSGSDTLTFDNYVVQAGDNSSDLEYVDTSALQLNGAVIQDIDLNDAILTLPTQGASGSFSYNNNFVVDTTAPAVADVISGTSDGSFNQGDHIGISVQFSEVVNVNTSGGTPSICFETGTTDRCVNYASGSGSTTLVFDDYVVQAGDNSSDLEYVDTSALHLNSAIIQDAAGNDANLTLPTPGASGSFGYNNNFVVDTTAPAVISVISGTSDGSFNQGDHIGISVQFSEVVNVNTSGGTPTICFETGTTDRCVSYASGSGSTTLAFDDYIVQAGDNSSDLEYVDTSALHLNSAIIQDAAGNDANLTLPTPG
ncbi:MAG TPA: hypothetical protein PK078_12735, partial [Anaerolineales bacterium]|nr:hypothetical protein [Anaerolineales bacterium]